MRYMGGKAKIAKMITDYLRLCRKPNQVFVEPFLGGCNILPLIDGERIAGDINKSVSMCFEAISVGWIPPENVSEEEYLEFRNAKDSALRGFVGMACSFGGKFFGGYARELNRNFALNGMKWAVDNAPFLADVKFHHGLDYSELVELSPNGSMIYCDPPYLKTTGYGIDFDHEKFWNWCRENSEKYDIYISEYSAPDDFECLLEISKRLGLRNKRGTQTVSIEKLFRYRGKK